MYYFPLVNSLIVEMGENVLVIIVFFCENLCMNVAYALKYQHIHAVHDTGQT